MRQWPGVSISIFASPPSSSCTIDKFFMHKKDVKAPPAPDTKVLDADLAPLHYTSLALICTWAQILFGVSQVTGPHYWFCCALGCILGVTVFSLVPMSKPLWSTALRGSF